MNQVIPPSALVLRPARYDNTQDDSPVLQQLLQAAFEEYRGKLDPPSGAHSETEERVRHLLRAEKGIVADWQGQPVGCVFYDERADHLYLHRLAVLPAFRRHGIGKALINAVEAQAVALNKPTVTLNVRLALPENRTYYERLGYFAESFGIHEGYRQFTYVTLSKQPLRPVAMRRIEIVPYNLAWPAMFAHEAALLRRVFGNELIAIHHIGSTSIPGLHAKPVIDMLPVVRNIERVNAFDPIMLALGYRSLGEFGLPGRRYFPKGSDELRTHHAHIYAAGNPEIDRHLAFRDYMIAHPAEVQHYSELKQRLARQFPTDINGYMDGKNGLIKEVEAKALVWWKDENWQLQLSKNANNKER